MTAATATIAETAALNTVAEDSANFCSKMFPLNTVAEDTVNFCLKMFPTLTKFKRATTTKAPPLTVEQFRQLQAVLFEMDHVLCVGDESQNRERAHAAFSLYLAGVHAAEYAQKAGISFEEELKLQMADPDVIRPDTIVHIVLAELLENKRIDREGTTREKLDLWRRQKGKVKAQTTEVQTTDATPVKVTVIRFS